MKETVILTIKLFVITAIVAVLLGAVNMVTKPIIAQNNEKTFQDNMKELLTEANKFELDGTELPPEKETGVKVGDVYCGISNSGDVVGYVTSAVCSEGYGGDIEVMVGIVDDNGEAKVVRAKVTAMSETPGLGAKSQSEWIDGYSGLGQGIEVNKNGSAASAEYKIDAISGATITSKAVTKAVNAALDAVKAVIDDNAPVLSDEENPSEAAEADENLNDTENSENSESSEDDTSETEEENGGAAE